MKPIVILLVLVVSSSSFAIEIDWAEIEKRQREEDCAHLERESELLYQECLGRTVRPATDYRVAPTRLNEKTNTFVSSESFNATNPFPSLYESLKNNMGMYSREGHSLKHISGRGTIGTGVVSFAVLAIVGYKLAQTLVVSVTKSPALAAVFIHINNNSGVLEVNPNNVGKSSDEIAQFMQLSPANQGQTCLADNSFAKLCNLLRDADTTLYHFKGGI